jgi:hypothetical protein
MQEPYALYKHNSCVNLAGIALDEKKYSLALKYIELFDKKYPYRHFCGNEITEERIFTAYRYAEAYLGLNDTDKALQNLLPNIIETGLAGNGYLVDKTIEVLEERYPSAYLTSEFSKSIDKLADSTIHNGEYTYTSYKINFLGNDIPIPDYGYYPSDTSSTLSSKMIEIKSLIRKGYFYTSLLKHAQTK